MSLHLGPTVVLSGRAAAWLWENLDRRRISQRSGDDDEIEAALRDLGLAALAYRNGQSQAGRRLQPLPEQPLTTQDVAAMHRVHEASVRRAIRNGRLPADQGRHGWQITPAAARDWEPRKVRSTGRAA